MLASLVNIKSIVKGQEASGDTFTSTLIFCGDKIVDMGDKLDDGCWIRACKGKVVNLITGKDTYMSIWPE